MWVQSHGMLEPNKIYVHQLIIDVLQDIHFLSLYPFIVTNISHWTLVFCFKFQPHFDLIHGYKLRTAILYIMATLKQYRTEP